MKNSKFGFEMKTYWDQWTTSYQMGEQKHRVFALDLLKEKGVKSVFDAGCGTGPIYQLIKETEEAIEDDGAMEVVGFKKRWEFTYKGTDYSPAMIGVAKENFPEANFEVQDARHLTEQDNSWDCVLLMHALDHLDDFQAAIKEASRVAKKFVCIILWRSFVEEGTRLNDRNMMDKKEGEEPWEDSYLHEYSREALENEFKKNNLIIEEAIEGEKINSSQSSYNFLYLLRKRGI